MVQEKVFKIKGPEELAKHAIDIQYDDQENCLVISLDGANQIIDKKIVTKGLVNQSQLHPREVFRQAIKDNAVSIAVIHNHPSGCLNPSQADCGITKRLYEAGKIIGIDILDHVIVSKNGYYSIREKNQNYLFN